MTQKKLRGHPPAAVLSEVWSSLPVLRRLGLLDMSGWLLRRRKLYLPGGEPRRGCEGGRAAAGCWCCPAGRARVGRWDRQWLVCCARHNALAALCVEAAVFAAALLSPVAVLGHIWGQLHLVRHL